MEDQVREAFQRVISAHNRFDQRTAQQEAKTDREQFEFDWTTAAVNIIVPALNEIVTSVLMPNGWRAGARMDGLNVLLEAYKGDMRGLGGDFGRPTLIFFPHPSNNESYAYSATHSEGNYIRDFTLAQLTSDFVQQCALSFFEKLCSEASPVS
jgi:hypothetical protein